MEYIFDYDMGEYRFPQFSFFRRPIQNTEPCRTVTTVDIYRYVTGPYAKRQTEQLRAIESSAEARRFKATHFDFCTFSGTFRKRGEDGLLCHSGLLCIDFDHVRDIEDLKQQLLDNEYFETELMFTSPSGDGVKWIIPVDLQGLEHERFFKAVVNCLKSSGLPEIDQSGKDVARSCFLPYDPHAYINQKIESYAKEKTIFRSRVGECPF